jgi:hypothetical protein
LLGVGILLIDSVPVCCCCYWWCALTLLPPCCSAGFPVTDAALSTSFAVVSGHAPDTIDWTAFTLVPTLVVLMGGRALPVIVSKLVDAGKAPDTPVRSFWGWELG